MNVTKKELPKGELELTIQIPYEDITKDLENASVEISKERKIEGFRPGKVPLDVLKKKIGEQSILEHALEHIIQRSFVRTVVDEDIETVGRPKINVTKAAPGNPIEYTATVALLPDVQLGEYKNLSHVEKKPVVVEDKDIERAINDVRNMRAEEKKVERAAQNGDKVEVDFTISVDKVPIDGGKSQNHPLTLGEKHFIPGFEDGIVGMKAGDEKTYPVHFPKEYHAKHLADKAAEAKVKVNAVMEVKTPEANDAFAKTLGAFTTIKEVEEQVRKNLSMERTQKEDQRYEGALVDEVVQHSTFGDIPHILVEGEQDKMLQELQQVITSQGMDFQNYLSSIKKTEDELKKEFAVDAEKRVKGALVLRAISKAENVTVGMDELETEKNVYLQRMSASEEMRKQIETPQFDEYLSNIIGNRKVFGILRSYAEKTPSAEKNSADTQDKDAK
ncbi:MAG: trigger factor [Patescibacteria group bacterium]|jgi:trigger factor